jgi:hypothetical protein
VAGLVGPVRLPSAATSMQGHIECRNGEPMAGMIGPIGVAGMPRMRADDEKCEKKSFLSHGGARSCSCFPAVFPKMCTGQLL